MYASEVEGQSLTFFVSGKLWGHSLVMGDKETNGSWSHILGKCMEGKLEGKRLTILPGTLTTWADWKEGHPQTTATMLQPTALEFNRNYMFSLERFCLALVHEEAARHWRFDRLKENAGPVNDSFGSLELVVNFDIEAGSATAWNRQSAEQTLTFVLADGVVTDEQTKSTWNLKKGLATDGALKGQRLEATSAIASFTNAWKRFHPATMAWEAAGDQVKTKSQ